MNINTFINFFGGIGLFLFGMKLMSESIENRAGDKLKKILNKVTKNNYYGIAIGAGVTALIQSSSALTVLLVGFVNSGIICFEQSIGLLMGSNIGTTITSWIVGLLDIHGTGLILTLLNPRFFTPLFAIIGASILIFSINKQKHSIANIIIGFSILMYGILIMSDVMKPLANNEYFRSILTAFNNPLISFTAGILFTAVIQSSSASIGVLQTLTVTGGITYRIAIPIILGLNIGTCITALISSIGVNINAKKVAYAHLLFNVLGSVFAFTVYFLIMLVIQNKLNTIITSANIAIVHTLFNVSTTILLLPFTKQLTKIINKTIKEK